ncbi:MAG: C2H2-type zinc finger protein, partial [Terracidiphilus sp.]|nr:C2H2-type zinc finger protein [Terracidiphilus sp.]
SGVPAGYQMIYSPMRPQSAFGTAWPVPDVSGHYGGYAPQAGPSSSADTIFATHSDPGMHAPLRDLVHAATALGDGVPATSSRLSSHPHPPARDDRDDKTFMCGTCDLPFASYAEYAAHQQHRHRSVPGTGGAKGRKYVCDVCAHVCMQSSDLKKHLRTHTGERPYECTICLSRFSRSDNLRVHVTNVHDMKKKGYVTLTHPHPPFSLARTVTRPVLCGNSLRSFRIMIWACVLCCPPHRRRMDAVREESAARKDGDAPSPPKRVKPELTA